jgi:DNA-binding NarL/FixJ family response regulator
MPDLQVCGVAASGQAALAQLPGIEADLVLVDIALPDMTGLEFVGRMQGWRPDLPIVIFSDYQEPTYVQRALAAGAQGYIVKGNPQEVATAIRRVQAGEVYLSPQLQSCE